ncbi:[NiFe] hydrogenase nickel incorporation-associated protein HypB [Rhodovulum sp. PH10]|uniref:hydrogenase nickel incorporation protein HypB n=1 Tax=Rhodovulum sp. PH10 TaxID=1187851 RepID=UPI00027C2AA6|nr:hydrogenase nickel incorporation protein HypB [Rhodovulum sp. PH10]EJW10686.1 [NiFe] hydrogenase nickel incorporation-associated protein HypB [Rhodovulum sp. PH10]
MCEACGCGTRHDRSHDHSPVRADHDATVVAVHENLLSENDHVAAHVREHLEAHGILAVNLMSSPGAGKTSLLEATIAALPKEVRIAVIEGDLETENDAERIRRHGVPAVQISTGVVCHLDAAMVHDALGGLSLRDVDILFIENVGNLVCPADFAVGQHRDVVLLSVTEGDDKPDKYPVAFRHADLVLVTKTDLMPHLDDFDIARAESAVERVRGPGATAALSARTGDGLAAWTAWLEAELTAHRAALRAA